MASLRHRDRLRLGNHNMVTIWILIAEMVHGQSKEGLQIKTVLMLQLSHKFFMYTNKFPCSFHVPAPEGSYSLTHSFTHWLTQAYLITYSPIQSHFFHSFITHLFTRLFTDIGDIGSCVSACSDRLFLVLESLVQYPIQASIASRDTSNPYISSYSWTFWYALMY